MELALASAIGILTTAGVEKVVAVMQATMMRVDAGPRG